MGKKIILGSGEPCIFEVKVNGLNCEGEKVEIADINSDGIFVDRDKMEPHSIRNNGIEIEMWMDELSQSIAYLRESTGGKITAVDFIKSMVRKSGDILGDDIFDMAAYLVKECSKLVDSSSVVETHMLKAASAVLENIYKDW